MAGLMAAPMLVLELVLMGSMYPNKKLNGVFVAIGLALALTFWLLIRQQTAISDRRFLKIDDSAPHGAILMCDANRPGFTIPGSSSYAKGSCRRRNRENRR